MPIYKLRDWIEEEKLPLQRLAQNKSPATMYYFDKHPDKYNYIHNIHKTNIIFTPDVIAVMDENDWEDICFEPELIAVIERNQDKINWRALSENAAACHLIARELANPNKNPSNTVCWELLSNNNNKEAVDLLRQNPDKIFWHYLSMNPAAIDLLKENPDKIVWENLSYIKDARAIKLLEQYPDKINWISLCENEHPRAIELMKKHLDKLEWEILNYNDNDDAINLLFNTKQEFIRYENLASSKSARAMEILKNHLRREENEQTTKYMERYGWDILCENPCAIELIERYKHNIDWFWLAINPAIFVYDYAAMRNARANLHEEFAAWWMHPTRVAQFLNSAENGIDALDNF